MNITPIILVLLGSSKKIQYKPKDTVTNPMNEKKLFEMIRYALFTYCINLMFLINLNVYCIILSPFSFYDFFPLLSVSPLQQ